MKTATQSAVKLSLVIPTHNRALTLERLLRSLGGQTLPREEFEVVVVSNCADDATEQLTKRYARIYPNLRHFIVGEKGVNLARNRGLRETRAEIVYFVDDDCEFRSASQLEDIIDAHDGYPTAAAIGGPYESLAADNPVARAYQEIAREWMESSFESPRRVAYESWRLVGGNVSYKKSHLRGLQFDPKIIFGGAETEFHCRLEDSGLKGILIPALAIGHRCEISTRSLITKALYQGISAGQIAKRTDQTNTTAQNGQRHPELRSLTRKYEIFFRLGFTFGLFHSAAPGRISAPLLIHCLQWIWVELLFPNSLSPAPGRLRSPKSVVRLAYSQIGRLYFYPPLSQLKFFAARVYWAAYHCLGQTRVLASSLYWPARNWLVYTFWARIQAAARTCYWFIYSIYWNVRGWCSSRIYWPVRTWLVYAFWSGVQERARRLFWFAHGLYWRAYSWHWKLRSPVVGALRALYFRDAALTEKLPFAKLRGLAIFRFLIFSLRHFGIHGSKTSAFLHRSWRAKTSLSHTPAVLVSRSSDGETTAEQCAIAGKFGFQKLALRFSLLTTEADIESYKKLLDRGFEIEFYCHSAQLEAAKGRLVELMRLGCSVYLRLAPEDLARLELEQIPPEVKLAIGPEFSASDVPALTAYAQARGSGTLIYVDFLDEDGFQPLRSFELMSALLARHAYELNLEVAQIYQPFDLHATSPHRLLSGEAVWMNSSASKIEWSVIIPCFLNFEYVPAVLRHLAKQEYELGAVEVILIDDGSPQPLLEALRSELDALDPFRILAKVVRLDRTGHESASDTTFRAGLARNAGILHSRGRKLLFLDSDILLSPDHLTNMDSALEQGDVIQSIRLMLKAEASSERTEVSEVQLTRDVYAEDYYWESFKKMKDWQRHSAPWKYVCTYALAMRRETIEQVGYFRPEFHEYGFEDTELGYRLFQHGFRFHLSKSPVYHLFPQERSFAIHFDEEARWNCLSRTATIFQRMHCDPAVFFELRSFLEVKA